MAYGVPSLAEKTQSTLGLPIVFCPFYFEYPTNNISYTQYVKCVFELQVRKVHGVNKEVSSSSSEATGSYLWPDPRCVNHRLRRATLVATGCATRNT